MIDQVRLFPSEPKKPRVPFWASICGWGALGVYAVCYSLLNIERVPSAVLASPLALMFGIGLLVRTRDTKRYVIDHIRWEIENLREALTSDKRDLEKGKPFYDDTPVDEWEFNLKYDIRHTGELLVELEGELSRLLKSPKSNA